jgi:hypothetical protein
MRTWRLLRIAGDLRIACRRCGRARAGTEMLPADRRALNDQDHISSSRRILSEIGGCVLNSFSREPMPSPSIREG